MTFVGACGDDATASDATVDGGGDAGPREPLAPTAVSFTPCPDGFREVGLPDGVAVCEPWADADPPACGEGEARFVGEAGCARVGSPCPAGDFPEVTTTGDVIHVDIDAATDGDGSRSAPFRALSAAVASASNGDVVVVAPGTYVSRIAIPPGVEVRGACPEATILTMDVAAPALSGLVTPDGLDARLTDVTIRDGADAGVFVRAGTSIHLSGVVIEDTRFGGVIARGSGRVTAESLVVRRAQPLEDGSFGRGLLVEEGASAEVRRGSFEQNRGAGVSTAGAGSSLILEDVAIVGTLPQSATREFGRGINAQDGASLVAERVLVEGNRDVGVYAVDSEASLVDVVIRRTLAQQSDNSAGRGLELDRSTASLTRVLLDENQEMGLYADDASLTLEDVAIRRIDPQALDLDYGRGINLAGGDHSFRRLFVEASHDLGIVVWNEGTRADLADVTVRDTRPMEATGVRGRAMSALFGPSITVRRGRFVNSHESGVSAVGPGTVLDLEDVAISGVAEAACASSTCSGAPFGIGIGTYEGARVSARRFTIEDAVFCGVHVALNGQLDLDDGRVVRSAIGACVQMDGYDVSRLTNGVAYVDNGVNLDATTLPIPPPASTATSR